MSLVTVGNIQYSNTDDFTLPDGMVYLCNFFPKQEMSLVKHSTKSGD